MSSDTPPNSDLSLENERGHYFVLSVLLPCGQMRRNKNYSATEIYALAKSINEDDVAYEWLKKNKALELAAVSCAFRKETSTKALKWLFVYDFRLLWSFVSAIEEDQKSFAYLMKNKGTVWAATVSASRGEKEAMNWLVRYNYKHYVALALAIRKYFEKDGDSGTFFAGDGGGFGAFDGGGFGGGGAGGSW